MTMHARIRVTNYAAPHSHTTLCHQRPHASELPPIWALKSWLGKAVWWIRPLSHAPLQPAPLQISC